MPPLPAAMPLPLASLALLLLYVIVKRVHVVVGVRVC